jgi:hypothetical protein
VLHLEAPEGWRWADEFVNINIQNAHGFYRSWTCKESNLDKTIQSILNDTRIRKVLDYIYQNRPESSAKSKEIHPELLERNFSPEQKRGLAEHWKGELRISFFYWFCPEDLTNTKKLQYAYLYTPHLVLSRQAIRATALSSLWDGFKLGNAKKNPDDDFLISAETIKEGARQISRSKFLRPRKFGRSYSLKALQEQLPELQAAIKAKNPKRFAKAWVKTGLDGASDAVFDGIISGAILIPGLAGAGLLGFGGAAAGSVASPAGTGIGAVAGAAAGGLVGAKSGYEAVKPLLRNPSSIHDRPTPRRTVRSNPYGTPVSGVSLVRVGKGTQVHIFDPKTGSHLCQSGKNAGSVGGSGVKPVARPATDAHFVTCYRCGKLAQMNKVRYGGFLPPDR